MARNMNQLAVLTGDVIASTDFVDRTALPHILREGFEGVARRFGLPVRAFEIYRGDSFQGVLAPEQALLAATIVRARLRSVRVEGRRRSGALDARVAIGIGVVQHTVARVVESDGEAYRLSGRALDEMARPKETRRLRVEGPRVHPQVQITVQLLDAIVSAWSVPVAESAFLALTETDRTQADMAERQGVSQPAISQRLGAARFDTVLELLDLYARALAIAPA